MITTLPKVTFIQDAEIRVLPDDNGAIPRQVRVFKAGDTVLLPQHQYIRAKAKGVIVDVPTGQAEAISPTGKNPRGSESEVKGGA
jgi:hypothetical protein